MMITILLLSHANMIQSLPGYSQLTHSWHHTLHQPYAISAIYRRNATLFPHILSNLVYCLYLKNIFGSRCCYIVPTYLISSLLYLSKLIKCVVVSRSADHSSIFNSLPVKQSAYRRFQSTETATVSVQNDLVRTADSGKVSLLVLLDLSAPLIPSTTRYSCLC